MSYFWLFPLGLLVGAYGTLVGAGGGFLLVPLLIFLYPREKPEIIASISLVVVFFNAVSGTVAYARMKRVDYFSGVIFAVAAMPGAIAGSAATRFLPRRAFDMTVGVVLLLAALVLVLHLRAPRAAAPVDSRGKVLRRMVTADGTIETFAYRMAPGVLISVLVGFLSSVLGIGGGVLHVPALIFLLGFPAHIATATSHFVLAFMALTGTVVHVATGAFAHGVRRAAWLGAGALIGAQFGARLSNQLHGTWLVRSLAVGLALVGLRLLLSPG